MQLLLRRDQKSGITGKITFTLAARAQLTPEEEGHVKRYKLGKAVLYAKEKVAPSGDFGLSGVAQNLAAIALNLKITVNDLVGGRVIECKDIIEMRAAEEQIKEACQMFKEILESAAHFEGEEVIEI